MTYLGSGSKKQSNLSFHHLEVGLQEIILLENVAIDFVYFCMSDVMRKQPLLSLFLTLQEDSSSVPGMNATECMRKKQLIIANFDDAELMKEEIMAYPLQVIAGSFHKS